MMFTQNVDGDYLNHPLALKLLLRLFPGSERVLYLEVNENVTSDYLSTIRTLAVDLDIRLILDDSNKMMSASCSMAPDSRRSLIMGRLSVRDSTPRLSWLSAMTGIPSSLARPLREREMPEISCSRERPRSEPLISCK